MFKYAYSVIVYLWTMYLPRRRQVSLNGSQYNNPAISARSSRACVAGVSRAVDADGLIPFAIANPVPLEPGVLSAVRALRGHPHHGSRLPQVYVYAFSSTHHVGLPGCGVSLAKPEAAVFILCDRGMAGSLGLVRAVERVVWYGHKSMCHVSRETNIFWCRCSTPIPNPLCQPVPSLLSVYAFPNLINVRVALLAAPACRLEDVADAAASL